MKKIIYKIETLKFKCNCGCLFRSNEYTYDRKIERTKLPFGENYKYTPEDYYERKIEEYYDNCPVCKKICFYT